MRHYKHLYSKSAVKLDRHTNVPSISDKWMWSNQFNDVATQPQRHSLASKLHNGINTTRITTPEQVHLNIISCR